METRILLLRHAETSAPDRFHGAESDIGLGERGFRQAAFLARHLAGFALHAVYASPMRRALDTARPIAAASGLEIEIVETLHERRMGTLSGREKAEARELYDEETSRWMAGDLDYHREGTESFVQVRDRAVPALHLLADRSMGQTLTVVVHGVLIRVVLASVLDDLGPADFDRIGIDNGAINDLRWDGRSWRAVALNQRPEGFP